MGLIEKYGKEISAETIAKLKQENPGRLLRILSAEFDEEEFEIAIVVPNKATTQAFGALSQKNPDEALNQLIRDCVLYPDANELLNDEYYSTMLPVANELMQLTGLLHKTRVKKA